MRTNIINMARDFSLPNLNKNKFILYILTFRSVQKHVFDRVIDWN